MTSRVGAILEMRLSKAAGSEWVFSTLTKSGHIEPPSLKKQHANAIREATSILRKQTKREDARFEGFELHTLRSRRYVLRWIGHK